MKKTVIIGLCGRSGGGKSTAVSHLRKRGFYCIDADEISRGVTAKGMPCLDELSAAFGTEILNGDGTLNRKMLACAAFASADKAKLLNKITHKYICASINDEIERAKHKNVRYIIIDAPLLYESGLDAQCNYVIAVSAPDGVCVKRIIERDGITEYAAQKRLASQKTNAFLHAHADFYISNVKTARELEKKIDMAMFCVAINNR